MRHLSLLLVLLASTAAAQDPVLYPEPPATGGPVEWYEWSLEVEG